MARRAGDTHRWPAGPLRDSSITRVAHVVMTATAGTEREQRAVRSVAQVFLTDDGWSQTLRGIHAVLRRGGHLVFETRRPEFRAWEEWAADTAQVTLDVPGIGPVERRFELTDVSLPFVSFRYTYRFVADGAVVTSDSTLRFRNRDEVETNLVADGYRVLDVREAPDRPGREFVFIAAPPP